MTVSTEYEIMGLSGGVLITSSYVNWTGSLEKVVGAMTKTNDYNTFEVPFLTVQDWFFDGRISGEDIPMNGDWAVLIRSVWGSHISVMCLCGTYAECSDSLSRSLLADWEMGLSGEFQYEIWHFVDGRADWYIDVPESNHVKVTYVEHDHGCFADRLSCICWLLDECDDERLYQCWCDELGSYVSVYRSDNNPDWLYPVDWQGKQPVRLGQVPGYDWHTADEWKTLERLSQLRAASIF